jgi:integrase
MVKRGEYRPPNGSAGSNMRDMSDMRALFDDPNIAWPKRAHWWHYVEDNENFALWLLNTAAGSPTTAIERARALARFLDRMNWSLKELTELALNDKGNLERRLELFARRMESQGYKRGSINNYFKAVRSWLTYNGVELTRRIKLNQTETKREKVPTPDELELVLKGADTRQAVCSGAVAYGGLRPEVLGQPKVYDGLKLGSLPELDLKSLEFTKIPTMVFVGKRLSKIHLPYRTFFPKPVCTAITEYLTIRRDKDGEVLTYDSPLVAVNDGWVNRGFRDDTRNRHVRSKTISKSIRDAIGGLGKWRPYDFRHYFLTWMKLAVARGACNEGYRIYWAGQRAKTADVYDLYKDEIPDVIIEDMRQQYKQAQEYLLPKTQTDEERLRLQSLLDFAQIQGWSDTKITRLKEVMTRPISFEEGLKEFRLIEENLQRKKIN